MDFISRSTEQLDYSIYKLIQLYGMRDASKKNIVSRLVSELVIDSQY
jgi:hypothetical protein